MGFWSLGFIGFRVQGLGFRVKGLGFRVRVFGGLGFRGLLIGGLVGNKGVCDTETIAPSSLLRTSKFRVSL